MSSFENMIITDGNNERIYALKFVSSPNVEIPIKAKDFTYKVIM